MATSSERRRRQRRRRRRGRGAGVVMTFFALVAIIGAIVAAVAIFFEIRTVSVTGESRYPASEIIASSQIEPGQNMFLFNKFSAYARIFQNHPYLDEISIRRRLPDHVEIIITECEPVAALYSHTMYESKPAKSGEEPEITYAYEYYIIDIKGKLLEKITSTQANGWLRIIGTSLKNPEVGKYAVFVDEQKQKPLFLVLNSAKDNDILQNIGEIDLTEAYDVSFRYMDRFTVKIGTTEELQKKIRFMNLVIDEHLSTTDHGTIDVSSIQTARFIKD